MRLLVVNDLFPPVVRGGYEVECRDVVAHLRERHEVTVLTSDLDAASAPAGEQGVRRELPWTGDQTRRDAALAALSARRAIAVMRRALAEVAPDAVYVWNGSGVPAAALRVVQQHPAPMLVRVCEYWFGRLYTDDQYTKWLSGTHPGAARGAWAAALRAANRLPGLQVELDAPRPVAVSWNAEYVRAHAQAPPSFEVVHADITIPSNARTRELDGVPRAPEPGRVLFVGRLDETKGAQVVVRALARLRAGGTEATLRVVGNGTDAERDALLALAAAQGVADRVALTGPLRGQPLLDEIAAASAWVIPSVWAEPAPLTCIEAALCRVPAVCSRVGGMAEVLEPDACALFFEREDDAGCAAALAATLAGGDEVQARAERAHARGRELSFDPYLARMDRFLEEGYAALRGAAAA